MSNSVLDWVEEALCAERQDVESMLRMRHDQLVKVLAQELGCMQWKDISPSTETLQTSRWSDCLSVDKGKVANSYQVSPRLGRGTSSLESDDADPRTSIVGMILPADAVMASEECADDDGNRLEHSLSRMVLGGRKTALDVQIPDHMKHGQEDQLSIAKCVKHTAFDHSIGFAILFNACVLLLQADYAVQNPGVKEPLFFDVMEIIFLTIFSVELALKLYVFRCGFFTDGDSKWNWFDALLVSTAIVELLIEYVAKTQAVSATMLRLVRIVKISRLIRIIRAVRIFRELRIMVLSIMATMRTLLWSIICVSMIMATISAYFAWVIADHLASNSEVDDAVVAHFGSILQIMITLFSAVTGGSDWREFSDILCEISPIACCIFFAYVSTMIFAIMNILTGICVNNATQAADNDMDLCAEDLLKNDPTVVKLREILTDGKKSTERTSSMSSLEQPSEEGLTWAQIRVHLGDPTVRAYFKKISLEPWQLRSFFQLLKVGDEEPEVGVDQFIRGCMRLRCNVKNIDLMAALHDNKQYETRRYEELRCHIAEVGELVSEMQRKAELQFVDHI